MHYRQTARIAALTFCFAELLCAQRGRITEAVDNSRRVVLTGHLHPKALAGVDQGRVNPDLVLPYMTLALKPAPGQQDELNKLLARQRDPSSPGYHGWLTPEQYAERFGMSQTDLSKIITWLRQAHLVVAGVARGRNWVAFRGTAHDVERAFATEIHHYLFNGEAHFANATDPSVPAAFQSVVSGIHGLNDFRMRPHHHTVTPHYTTVENSHELAPGDIATIYDINPLYNQGIDGTGQKVAIAGQTQIHLSDIQTYRTNFGLTANNPQVMLVPNTKDPGISQGDLGEADLDLEIAGAVARNATLIYVYSTDVFDSVQYAIDQNLAPVLSVSYGSCELENLADAMTMQASAQQGNAQGITWFAASGDQGAADCLGEGGGGNDTKLSVDLPAAIPEVTGVGGTEFNEGHNNYWNPTNGANSGSAVSYIPETSWNDSILDNNPSASGGGASIYFAKPDWQVGTGVPNDNARDVPDVSLSASADHDGYAIYSNGRNQVVAGTSADAPLFAGIAALLNHYLTANGLQHAAGLGNINPDLYNLAHNSPAAFHDITTGDNKVEPCLNYTNCKLSAIGYSAGPGYDQVTGLGSVDVFNMFTAWHTSAEITPAAVSMTVSASAASINFGDDTMLIATVKSPNTDTPDGTVTFSVGTVTLGTATLTGSGGSASGSLTVHSFQLAAGANSISVQYSGSTFFQPATAAANVTVNWTPSGPPAIGALTNGASFAHSYAPGMTLTVFGTNLAPTTGIALAVPLPAQLAGVTATVNGITAPFYYVSPLQLNLQVPYGIAANSQATLTINNNGQSSSATFQVAASAPGIFVNQGGAPVPNTSAGRGQTVTLFITGAGAVSPSIATGAAPVFGTPILDLPMPVLDLSVTVAGLAATIQFQGIPWALAGVMQVNYQVPFAVSLGNQPVVVTVGGVPSPPAMLNVMF